ncbi:MAG: cation-transporting P-type ATPase, partial [Candidatus Bilamarchaeaceae archaeon]
QFSTSEKGLTDSEAKLRLQQYGPNSIPDKDRRTWLDIFISQVSSPLLLILVFAALLSAFIGEPHDTLIILGVVLASVLLGFYQEYKSERTLSQLKKHFSIHASVIRNGEKMQIDSRELVPGDIVTIGLGDIVPADIRLIHAQNLILDESTITGESREVKKDASK